MNASVFHNWLETKVFPAMKSRRKESVLVLDSAQYHTKLTENTKPPRKSCKKAQLVQAIKDWGEKDPNWPEDWDVDRKVTKIFARKGKNNST